MMIALPNLDGSFTVTLFFPLKEAQGKVSFETLTTKYAVEQFFKDQFPDAVPLMPNLLDDFFLNPTSNLVTVKCFPWTFLNKVTLVGDAAHAIVPFFGQGMNCGFEDVSTLDEILKEHGVGNWSAIFDSYQNLRVSNANAIADMAQENYIEMRDRVADANFIFRKKN